MHDHALPAIGDADDAFARHGLAAGGAAEGLVIRQADDGAGGIHLIVLRTGKFGVEGFDDAAGRDLGAAQTGEEVGFIGKAQHLGGGAERLVGGLFADMVEGRAGEFLTQFDETAPVFFAQGFADGGLGAARGDDVDP